MRTPEQRQERLEQLAEWTRRVVELFHPQKVILFGSYAYGTPTGHSDVDVLIVMDTDLDLWEQAGLIARAVKYRGPMDLIVRTPELLAQRLELGDFFLREIVDRGIVLYEAPDR